MLKLVIEIELVVEVVALNSTSKMVSTVSKLKMVFGQIVGVIVWCGGTIRHGSM